MNNNGEYNDGGNNDNDNASNDVSITIDPGRPMNQPAFPSKDKIPPSVMDLDNTYSNIPISASPKKRKARSLLLKQTTLTKGMVNNDFNNNDIDNNTQLRKRKND